MVVEAVRFTNEQQRTSALCDRATPPNPPDLSCFQLLKRWQPDDSREKSVARDLRATAWMCEVLGLCSVDDAQAFREPFEELADLGYAGYCYYDFASVSLNGLIDTFDRLKRQQVNDPDFKPVAFRNTWPGEFLNARNAGSHGSARIAFKNAKEPHESAVSFCRMMRYDDKYGVEPGETTATEAAQVFLTEFANSGAAHRAILVPARDALIMMIMDVIDQLHPYVGDEELWQRIPAVHPFKDVAAGRFLPGDRTGHLFLHMDNSFGIEATAGFETVRTSICVGAEFTPSVETSSPTDTKG
ncbi:hypothetical protein [Rhodococcus koreensis]